MAKRVFLIGHPVEHSLSAALQQAAFDALGIDATYELLDRLLIDLPETIAGLRSDDSLGANITVPYKERVVPMIDRLTEEAQQTGAVDTITREGSRLIGHNTDVLGFRPALDALVGKQKMPKSAIVLGAGGGARASVYGLITAGFQRVIVFNRHLHRAEGLVRHFTRTAAHMELRAMPWHESVIEAELAKAKLLINASSIGRDGSETPIPAELLPPELMVLDLLYTPKESRLLREARSAGATAVMNGDLMLLHQSAAAFELWTGRGAPMDLFRQRLDEVREGRPAAPYVAAAVRAQPESPPAAEAAAAGEATSSEERSTAEAEGTAEGLADAEGTAEGLAELEGTAEAEVPAEGESTAEAESTAETEGTAEAESPAEASSAVAGETPAPDSASSDPERAQADEETAAGTAAG